MTNLIRTAAEIQQELDATHAEQMRMEERQDAEREKLDAKIAALESELSGLDAEPVGYGSLARAIEEYSAAWSNYLYAKEGTNTQKCDERQQELVEARLRLNEVARSVSPSHPAPAAAVGKPKMAAGDCVEYLVKEYALDNPPSSLPKQPRLYQRDGHHVMIYHESHPNTVPVVATAGVVERIRVVAGAIRPEFDSSADMLLKATKMITTLPEPSDYAMKQCQVNCDNRIVLNLPANQALMYAAALVVAAEGGEGK